MSSDGNSPERPNDPNQTRTSEQTETKTPTRSQTDCASGTIHVSVDPTAPDDAAVLDAREDGLLDEEYFAGALSEAQREYRTREMDNESNGVLLVIYSDGDLLSHDETIRERIGYAKRTSVEYENVTYQMKYLIAEC